MTGLFLTDLEKPMNNRKLKDLTPAVWALTPKAAIVAMQIMENSDCGKLFIGPSIKNPPAGAIKFKSLPESVENEFRNFSAHIFIMAVGIVVRVIAPYVKSKLTDPAVVVVDDQGKFAVSLLSGHLGGANELTLSVSRYLNAVPVITTATDIGHIPAIDMLAVKHNLMIENPEAIKTIHMAMLEGQKIGLHDPINILQNDLSGWIETGSKLSGKSLSGVFVDYKTTPLSTRLLVLRPKILSVGVGCNRNTGIDEILAFLKNIFFKFNLSIKCIDNIATIEAKADEQGILELVKVLEVPVKFFGREELDHAGFVPTPSEVVKKHMGVASVCEAAAILASNQGKLLVPKQVTKNVTVAVGVRRSMLLE
jgi:cobalt-precorrin 5A hydrolase